MKIIEKMAMARMMRIVINMAVINLRILTVLSLGSVSSIVNVEYLGVAVGVDVMGVGFQLLTGEVWTGGEGGVMRAGVRGGVSGLYS